MASTFEDVTLLQVGLTWIAFKKICLLVEVNIFYGFRTTELSLFLYWSSTIYEICPGFTLCDQLHLVALYTFMNAGNWLQLVIVP